MRWFSFAILALITLVLQVGATRVFGLGPQSLAPDLLLLVAVVLALRGPADGALIACWILGLAKDLTSAAALGSYALAFGLLALVIVRLRNLLYVPNPLTLIVLTALASLAVEQAVYLMWLLRGGASGGFPGLLLQMALSALITAALAPYGQWLILKLHHPLGLPRHRAFGR